jgi:fructosamine-3-kinase
MSRVPQPAAAFIREQGWGGVESLIPVSGGCINDGARLQTASGPALFLKRNASAPREMFRREAEGLEALRVEGGPRVPAPLLAGDDFILLEYLAPAPQAHDCWETLGARLARLHLVTGDRFGFAHDNYIGSTPQPNRWEADGFAFFAEQRLLFQGRLARERGLLGSADARRLEQLAARLRGLIPEQPASLIHGDLWGGNVIPGPEGHACLIDPAAHFGWAEAELAMTALFGRFAEGFYAAYESVRPLEPGYRSRFDLYNLYHLLNHLNLFGGSYLSSAQSVLARYS